MIEQRFMTIKEAAIYVGASERTIRNLLADGSLTRFEVRRAPRIEIAELDAHLARNLTPAMTARRRANLVTPDNN